MVSYQTTLPESASLRRVHGGDHVIELDNTDQLRVFYEDVLANRLTMLPPDVNQSCYRFVPVSRKAIRYAPAPSRHRRSSG